MLQRSCLPILAAMLLVLPATGIVNAEDLAEPAITEQVSENITLNDTDVEPVTCDSQVLADALEAEPIQTEGLTNICGSCSRYPCKGVTRGTPCASGKWCIPATTMLCPGTSDWDCRCASNYF